MVTADWSPGLPTLGLEMSLDWELVGGRGFGTTLVLVVYMFLLPSSCSHIPPPPTHTHPPLFTSSPLISFPLIINPPLTSSPLILPPYLPPLTSSPLTSSPSSSPSHILPSHILPLILPLSHPPPLKSSPSHILPLSSFPLIAPSTDSLLRYLKGKDLPNGQ